MYYKFTVVNSSFFLLSEFANMDHFSLFSHSHSLTSLRGNNFHEIVGQRLASVEFGTALSVWGHFMGPNARRGESTEDNEEKTVHFYGAPRQPFDIIKGTSRPTRRRQWGDLWR